MIRPSYLHIVEMYERIEAAFQEQVRQHIPLDAGLLLDWFRMSVRALHVAHRDLERAYGELDRDAPIVTCPDCGKSFPSCNSGHYCFGTMKDGSFFQFRQIPKNEG